MIASTVRFKPVHVDYKFDYAFTLGSLKFVESNKMRQILKQKKYLTVKPQYIEPQVQVRCKEEASFTLWRKQDKVQRSFSLVYVLDLTTNNKLRKT